MRLLLDTHALIWFAQGDASRMPQPVWDKITSPHNECVVSFISLWEIAIKSNIGKLTFPPIHHPGFPDRLKAEGFELLPLSFPEIRAVATLPDHHHDPFDRILVTQSKLHALTLLSCDTKLDLYNTDRIWL